MTRARRLDATLKRMTESMSPIPSDRRGRRARQKASLHRVAVKDPYPLVRAALERLVDDHPALTRATGTADVAVLGAGADADADDARGGAVLALLDAPTGEDVARALRAGARGVLPRTAEPEHVGRAITLVADGMTLVPAELVPELVEQLVRRPDVGRRAFPTLTGRERDVIARLALGETNGQIAQALGLSTKTVRNHVSSICTKLRVLDRVQAVLAARATGLGQPRP